MAEFREDQVRAQKSLKPSFAALAEECCGSECKSDSSK